MVYNDFLSSPKSAEISVTKSAKISGQFLFCTVKGLNSELFLNVYINRSLLTEFHPQSEKVCDHYEQTFLYR